MKKTMSRLFTAVLMAALLIGASIMSVSAATVTATQPCDGLHTGWTAITAAGDITKPGNYYLDADITSGRITIKNAASPVTLCLNRHSISSTNVDFPLYAEGDIKLCNCSATGGNISGGTTRTAIFGGGSSLVSNVEVYDNVHFDNGTITCAASWSAVIQVNGSSSLTMYGGTVSNNKVTNTQTGAVNTAAIAVNGGALTLNGGEISGNTIVQNGENDKGYTGVVYVCNATGRLNMNNGAQIRDNKVKSTGNIGNVLIHNNAVMNMNGGEIAQNDVTHDNSRNQNGGGVSLLGAGATLNMSSGTISGNTAKNGGGVYVYDWSTTPTGAFNMTGGTISGNTATGGSAVHVQKGSFVVSNGSVVDGVLGKASSGVIAVSGGKFSADVTNYVVSGKRVVSISEGNLKYEVVDAAATECPDHSSGWTAITNETVNKAANWTADITVGGRYYLSEDLNTNQLTFDATGDVILCLNGHTISSTSVTPLYILKGNVTLCNCDATKGSIYGGATSGTVASFVVGNGGIATICDNVTIGGELQTIGRCAQVNTGGTLIMEGGTISNAQGVVTGGGVWLNGANSTFTMNDGKITGNKAENGGGVYVGGGTFTMTGGTISINCATSSSSVGGGGVCVNNSGKFILKGTGSIEGNEATTLHGSGVAIYNSTFDMQGGAITGNKAGGYGGGVAAHSGSSFTMSGGAIGENTATTGGTGVGMLAGGTTAVSGGSIDGTISGKPTISGGKFSNDVSHANLVSWLTTDENAGMLSVMNNTGTDAASYPYVVGEGYNRVGEFMDFQSSLNLTIALGADIGFTADGVTATVNGNAVAATVANDTLVVPISGIVAKAMGDEYAVAVKKGDKVLYSETLSVRKLAGEWYADEDTSDQTMLADMINYGIEAQKEFLGAAKMESLGNTNTVANWNVADGSGVNAGFENNVAVALSLKDQIELNIYVNAKVDVVSSNNEYVVENVNGITRISFKDINVVDAHEAVVLNLSNGAEVKFSIADYCALAKGGDQKDLIKALMKYIQSVCNYVK